jgi:hypothetical protein
MALHRQIGASMNARGKASGWAHDPADSRLANRRGGLVHAKMALWLFPRSANSRQSDPLGRANATWRQNSNSRRLGSNQVEPPARRMRPAARRANARDQEAMAGRSKAVGEAHGIAQLEDLIIAKLDDAIA